MMEYYIVTVGFLFVYAIAMSQDPERPTTVITVTNEVTNYPVPLGDLAEFHSFARLPSVLHLRLLAIEGIDGNHVTVSVGHQDIDPVIYEADSGIRLVMSCQEVVLPWWCLFQYPYAWYVNFGFS